jgi:hypothetical protein
MMSDDSDFEDTFATPAGKRCATYKNQPKTAKKAKSKKDGKKAAKLPTQALPQVHTMSQAIPQPLVAGCSSRSIAEYKAICKKCPKVALPKNYGFCADHRTSRGKETVKQKKMSTAVSEPLDCKITGVASTFGDFIGKARVQRGKSQAAIQETTHSVIENNFLNRDSFGGSGGFVLICREIITRNQQKKTKAQTPHSPGCGLQAAGRGARWQSRGPEGLEAGGEPLAWRHDGMTGLPASCW